MTEPTRARASLPAPLPRILAVLTDIERYPQWATQFDEAEVIERDDAGRPRLARFSLNAGLLKDRFVLRYAFDDRAGATTMSWELVEARQLERLDGSYRLVATADGSCDVEYSLVVDPGLPVITALRQKAERVVIATALDDLQRRVTMDADPAPQNEG